MTARKDRVFDENSLKIHARKIKPRCCVRISKECT